MTRGDHLPDFSDDIKKHWIVRRDECGDEYIALNGKNALGKVGIDHIYLQSENTAGLWITSIQVRQKITALRKKVPSLMIEQLGDGEAVVSVPIEDLHDFCKAAGARKRKKLTEEQRQRLRENLPFAKTTNKRIRA